MEDKRSGQIGLQLSDAFLIVAVSAVGYLVSYAFEFGYCFYFGIPREFISVGLHSILFFVAAFLVYGFINTSFLAISLGRITSRVFPRAGALLERFQLVVVAALMFTGLVVIAPTRYVVLSALFSLLVLFSFVQIASSRSEHHKVEQLFATQTFFSRVVPLWNLGSAFLTALFFSWLLLTAAGMAGLVGYSMAGSRQRYPVVRLKNQEMVILRNYDDRVVLATFDRQTRTAHRELIVLKLDDLHDPIWLELVGPLKGPPPP